MTIWLPLYDIFKKEKERKKINECAGFIVMSIVCLTTDIVFFYLTDAFIGVIKH